MRCVIGVVLFVVLYFGSCKLLGEIVSARSSANNPRQSQKAARSAGAKAVTKYHALVAVGAGAVSLLACSLPWLIGKMQQRDDWAAYAHSQSRLSMPSRPGV
jgi:hypothetical protein